jgi:hypothetical protein
VNGGLYWFTAERVRRGATKLVREQTLRTKLDRVYRTPLARVAARRHVANDDYQVKSKPS